MSSKVAHHRKSVERSKEINKVLSSAFSTVDGRLADEFACRQVSRSCSIRKVCKVYGCVFSHTCLIRNLIWELYVAKQTTWKASVGTGQDQGLQKVVSSVHTPNSWVFPRVKSTRAECKLSLSVEHTFSNANYWNLSDVVKWLFPSRKLDIKESF